MNRTTPIVTTTATLYTALRAALEQAAQYNSADEAAPEAVLWTDPDRQWEPLLLRLRAELPILTLGPYDPTARSGPAIWLRCMVARTLPEADWPAGATPIIYLPGVSCQALRDLEECPQPLRALADLQFRGVLWTHRNRRDWTPAGFLQDYDDLEVSVAADEASRKALRNALPKLADEPLEALRAESPLTAAKLNLILNPEPVRNLLLWMNDPAGRRARLSEGEWAAFRATCTQQFGFDPVADGAVTAALLLGQQEGAWHAVWRRFAEAPRAYAGLPELLRRARPAETSGMFYRKESWPQENEAEEEALRERLTSLREALPAESRKQLHALETVHAPRREWVWAELGQAPLAQGLAALTTLAQCTQKALGGAVPHEIAESYVSGGWRADAAAMEALRISVESAAAFAMQCAVDSLYRPWLSASAEAFQAAVDRTSLPSSAPPDPPKPGCCWLFADGLRCDVAQELAERLEKSGADVARGWQWGGVPGVTASAKPAVSPAASRIGPGAEFNTAALLDGSTVNAAILRRELGMSGFAILTPEETGSPSGAAWTESGSLDSTGHAVGIKLARRIPEEIGELASRVRQLLEAGWTEVRIVTDHGWLLLPFGLPKAELPEHLTLARKGRCARLKPSATTDQQTVPWRWDKSVRIAVPPGICCYVAGHEYDHGGLSPQECVTPVLTVRAGVASAHVAAITQLKWVRLRCRIQTTGASAGARVDLRTKPADPGASIAESLGTIDSAGRASVTVADDGNAGTAATVVLLSPEGSVAAQQTTVVGENI